MHDSSPSFSTSPLRISTHLARSVGRHPLMTREEEAAALGNVHRARVATWAAVLSSPRHAAQFIPDGALDTDEGRTWTAAYAVAFRTAAGTRQKRAALDAARGPFAARLGALDVDGSATIALACAAVRGPVSHAQSVRRASLDFLAAVRHVEAHNVRLVVATANTFRRFLVVANLSVDDLVGWGWPGLRRAVMAFDVSRGLRFSTYAIWWLKHSMRRAVQDHGRTIRVPVHMQDRATAITREVAALVRDGFTHEEAVEAVRHADPAGYDGWVHMAPPISIDAPAIHLGIDRSESVTLADQIPDAASEPADEAAHRAGVSARVGAMLGGLTARERAVVEGRFGLDGDEPRNLTQVGVTLGVSRERVRQLEQAAMAQLQFHARREGLVDGVVRRPLSARQASLHTHRVPAGEQVALAL